MTAKYDHALTNAARAALVILECVSDWDTTEQITINRQDMKDRWLQHYPRHGDTRVVHKRMRDGLKRLEAKRMIRRGFSLGALQSDCVLAMDIIGLRALAVRLDELEDEYGISAPPVHVTRPVRTRMRGCTGKKAYESNRAALLTLLRIWQRNPQRRERRTYWCPACGWWHVTSQNED